MANRIMLETTIYVPKKILKELKKLARKQGRKIAELIREEMLGDC